MHPVPRSRLSELRGGIGVTERALNVLFADELVGLDVKTAEDVIHGAFYVSEVYPPDREAIRRSRRQVCGDERPALHLVVNHPDHESETR